MKFQIAEMLSCLKEREMDLKWQLGEPSFRKKELCEREKKKYKMVTPVLRFCEFFLRMPKNCLCKKLRNLVDSHPFNFSLSQNSPFFKGCLPYHSIPLHYAAIL